MDRASDVDSTSTPTAGFFSLPPELRDEVYLRCLPGAPIIIDIDRKQHPHWILTSKQIFFEATQILYPTACLYNNFQLPWNGDLLQHIWWGYFGAFEPFELRLAVHTWQRVSALITTIAIDAELDIGADHLNPLGTYYLKRIGELTGLRKLYICLTPHSVEKWNTFRREIRMSELRIFHITNLMLPMERLKSLVPEGCEIIWRIPEHLRGERFPRRMIPARMVAPGAYEELEQLMKEVNAALDATVPRER